MHGLRVLGPIAELDAQIAHARRRRGRDRHPARLGRRDSRRSSAICQRLAVPVRIVPGVENWMSAGRRPRRPARNHARRPSRPRAGRRSTTSPAAQSVRDRVVLVTGAAGSIGSELCRQVAHLPAARTAPARQQRERALRPRRWSSPASRRRRCISCGSRTSSMQRKVDELFEQVRPAPRLPRSRLQARAPAWKSTRTRRSA